MSIIEQATLRLEQLKHAGIDVPTAPDAARVSGAIARSANRATLVRDLPAAPRRALGSGRAQSREVQLDLSRLLAEGYITPDDPRTGLAEELRAIKRPIIDHAMRTRQNSKERGNLVIVTSAMPGDGKTFCAINLALSIATEVDHSVLLVDADVVRPSILSRLGVEAGLGLLDVLTNPSLDLSDVLMRTNIPKLSLLAAGSPTPKSTELLASSAMEGLLSELAARYSDRIIIFDAPPLLATSESRVLASRMGQVLMVVQANATQRGAVIKAFADIQSCETVWCVLNGGEPEHGATGYGYYSQFPSA